MSPDPKFKEQVVTQQVKESEQPVAEAKPTVLVTELDAYISERIKSQPSVEDYVPAVDVTDSGTRTRVSLPDFFESQSHDCTVGPTCKFHKWSSYDIAYPDNVKIKRWDYERHGKFIFRWILKDKRSIDQHLSVIGWMLANRRAFPDVPKHLLTANGGIENGDMILAFMPVKQALAIREAPGKMSTNRLKGRMTTKDGKVIMTGDLNNPAYYVPELPTEVGTEGNDQVAPDVKQEGRDF